MPHVLAINSRLVSRTVLGGEVQRPKNVHHLLFTAHDRQVGQVEVIELRSDFIHCQHTISDCPRHHSAPKSVRLGPQLFAEIILGTFALHDLGLDTVFWEKDSDIGC